MILLILYKKTDFDDKLKKLNKNFTSNKTKHVVDYWKNQNNINKRINKRFDK